MVPPSNSTDDAPYISLVESNTTDPVSTPAKLFEVASRAVVPVRSLKCQRATVLVSSAYSCASALEKVTSTTAIRAAHPARLIGD